MKTYYEHKFYKLGMQIIAQNKEDWPSEAKEMPCLVGNVKVIQTIRGEVTIELQNCKAEIIYQNTGFSSGKISGLFSSKLLVYLGGISYSYYLTHQYIGYMVMRYGYSLGLSYFAVLLIAIVITLLLATILNRFIEVPGSRKLRKALEKKFQLSR